MEPSRKNDDCYFYYYSTCMKGDSCAFRHEPVALGNETMCTFWQQGKCVKPHCNYRHMELRKNRKQIPCYWEKQPSGCRKPHCPFMHSNPKDAAVTDPDKSKDIATILATSGVREGAGLERPQETQQQQVQQQQQQQAQQERSVARESRVQEGASDGDLGKGGLRRGSQGGSEASYVGSPPVDPVVVNFEEESDNESVPTSSPAKKSLRRRIHVKTLEEIRLEQIQAESAAFYGYRAGSVDTGNAVDGDLSSPEDADCQAPPRNGCGWEGVGNDSRPWRSFENGVAVGRVVLNLKSRSAREREKAEDLGFEVMSLSEIRKRRLREESDGLPAVPESNMSNSQVTRYAAADTSMPENSDSPSGEEPCQLSEPSRARKRSHSPIVFPRLGKEGVVGEEVDGGGSQGDVPSSEASGGCCEGRVGTELPLKRTRRLVRHGVVEGVMKGPRAVRLLRKQREGINVNQMNDKGDGGSGDGLLLTSNSDEVSGGHYLGGEVALAGGDSLEAHVGSPKSSVYGDMLVGKGDFCRSSVDEECSKQLGKVDIYKGQSALGEDVSVRLGDDDDDEDFLGEGQGLVTSTSISVDEDIIQDIDDFLNN